jgi:hypothetical protein
LPEVTLDAGGRLAIVNHTATHLDPFAALVARGPAAVVLGETRRLLSGAPRR